MSKIAVVYYSGYGHTKVIAETFANEIQATLIEIDQEGNIQDQDWDTLDALMQLYLVHQLIWAVCLGNLKIC
jgi:flavodoxin